MTSIITGYIIYNLIMSFIGIILYGLSVSYAFSGKLEWISDACKNKGQKGIKLILLSFVIQLIGLPIWFLIYYFLVRNSLDNVIRNEYLEYMKDYN